MSTGVDERGHVTADLAEVLRVRDEWALAIGRFIVGFAGCEYWTYLFIRNFGSEKQREDADRQPLWKRISVAHELLLGLGLKTNVREQVDSAFARFRKLTTTRNVLAHNAPMVHVFLHEETGEMQVRHDLRSARDPSREVTIKQLDAEATEAAEVEEEFAILIGVVRQPSSRG